MAIPVGESSMAAKITAVTLNIGCFLIFFFCCFLLFLFRSGAPGVPVAVVMERVEAAEDDVVEQVA